MGAVELVGPPNKHRPGRRHTFAVECGRYRCQEVGLLEVDLVTNRTVSLHRQRLDLQVANGSEIRKRWEKGRSQIIEIYADPECPIRHWLGKGGKKY